MKRSSAITSVESKADFPEKLLEKFVQENLPMSNWKQFKTSGMGAFSEQYKEIESCAAETPVGGSVEIFFTLKKSAARCLTVPVNSRFFVYCTRKAFDSYRVAWSCSLS